MLTLRSPREIAQMRKAVLLVWEPSNWLAHWSARRHHRRNRRAPSRPFFIERGAIPLFKGCSRKVPFPPSPASPLTKEVVHGIPGKRKLAEGDVVSIDTGCKLDGWCGDSAVTLPVGRISSEHNACSTPRPACCSCHRAVRQAPNVERSRR